MNLDQVPGWAYSWCYYAFGVTLVIAFTTAMSTFMAFRKIGVVYALMVLLLGGIATVNGMMSFWICRSSLKA
jgi:hypothetical protein